MKKKIEIDIYTLIFILGLLLIIISFVVLMFYYIYLDMYICTLDPVQYANNNSENYWWDNVYGVKYGFYYNS